MGCSLSNLSAANRNRFPKSININLEGRRYMAEHFQMSGTSEKIEDTERWNVWASLKNQRDTTWRFQLSTHLKHMLVKMGSSSPSRNEHKNKFELPPPRIQYPPQKKRMVWWFSSWPGMFFVLLYHVFFNSRLLKLNEENQQKNTTKLPQTNCFSFTYLLKAG